MQVALRSAVLRPQQRASAPGRRATACSVARHQPHSARRAAAPLSPLAPRRSLACRAATLDAAATAAPPSSVNWREQWYAVAFLSDLDPVAPVPFQLLGENMCVATRGHESSCTGLTRALTAVCCGETEKASGVPSPTAARTARRRCLRGA